MPEVKRSAPSGAFPESRTSSPVARWPFIVLAIGAGFEVLEAQKDFWTPVLFADQVPFWFTLARQMPFRWLMWAILTPGVVWLARQARLDDPVHRRRNVAIHIAGAAAAGLVHVIVVGTLFHQWMTVASPYQPEELRVLLRRWYMSFAIPHLVTYAAIVGAAHAIDYWRRLREVAVTRARLEQGLAEARLQALQTQLNPHFLFNALNAVTGLIRDGRNTIAVEVVARIGDLLRATMDRTDEPETTLAEELSLLELYLDVERCRFGDRLQVEVVLPDALRGARVPTLSLQPLVENAIRHGVAQHPGAGRVTITALAEGEGLMVRVHSTGSTTAARRQPGQLGIGLTNTRARLAQLYGAHAGYKLEFQADGSALASVWMPLHMDEDAPDAGRRRAESRELSHPGTRQ